LFEVIMSERAARELRDLPQQDAQRIVAAIEKLATWPEVRLDVAKLVGERPGAYRLRVGRYRCHLKVQWEVRRITVSSVSKRQRAYS